MRSSLVNWCRPVTDRLVTNCRGYWRRYRWLLVVAGLAALADMASTIWFMRAEGIDQELHPGIRLAAGYMGPIVGPIAGKLVQFAAILLVTLYARRIAVYVFIAVTIMYGWAAWYNVCGRDLYVPALFKWLML